MTCTGFNDPVNETDERAPEAPEAPEATEVPGPPEAPEAPGPPEAPGVSGTLEGPQAAFEAPRTENPSRPEPHGLGLRFCSWDAESDADVDAWFRGRTDPEFRRWNTPISLEETVEDARESLRERARWDADGKSCAFRIVDAETGATLGQIGLNGIDTFMRRAVVGYWVLPEARGRGVQERSGEWE
ncbi:hypothetical protein SGFS_054390 [Streptomyces graminofaciens]|uniref:N-acetyltransferase domain-containing protein n=1 Tax=Streptomyces graminofaciens TaxID=68212 RepID=A0ABN5VNL0_9ACTN|nr:hypothetical protein SGFS_054390 [Streptomyces graminofaciens]